MSRTRGPINRCCLSYKRQRELCLRCTLPDCDSTSANCSIRLEVNRLLRAHYWKNPEKARASRRKENVPAEQWERKKEYNRRRYHMKKQAEQEREGARE